MTVIRCDFDKGTVWRKVGARKPVVLDMNIWIHLRDEKYPTATRVKEALHRHVSNGLIFCPLSFGLLSELYKQAEDSRLRTGTLMENLSMNVTYVPREEVFAWEVERAVRRIAEVGTIDMSLDGLYAPIVAFLGSRLGLELCVDLPQKATDYCGKFLRERLAEITVTELLKMRAENKHDKVFDPDEVPAPKYSEGAKRIREITKGDKEKERAIELHSVMKLYVLPAMYKLPPPTLDKLVRKFNTVYNGDCGQFLSDLIELTPAIRNYIDLMATVCQFPARKDDMNDFFDYEIMSVPLAYASVFASLDKGIRDLLHTRTPILNRTSCRYCADLEEIEDWLKTLP